MLVNTALDVAPHDAEIGRLVDGYLGELRSFFRRNIEAAQEKGRMPRHLDPQTMSAHLLGVLLGIRVLARTGGKSASAKRKLLEGVARPTLDQLVPPSSPARRARS